MTTHKVAGRYQLRHEIGRGGAGAVWLAVDEVLGREVALKRIGLPPGSEDVDVARAEREARLAAQVTEPNVVAVFDFVAGEDEHWLVMEYVAGTNLARMVRERGALPPVEAARILADAARGLAAAHALGIVHRDVKPSNILVGTDGTVKLSDFGIARAASDATLTRTGMVTGSPAYLAPEVVTGGSATAASDVWSLGATLHHVLTGAPPYHGAEATVDPVALLYRIAHEPVPTVETEPWAAALLRATMTHDPQQRPTADAVAARLTDPDPIDSTTQVMTDPVSARSPEPRTRRRGRGPLWVGAAAVAVVVLSVVGFLLGLRSGGDASDPAAAGESTATATRAPGTTGPPTSETAEPAVPTAADLEDFARTYVATASSDPDAGFAMLTADFQAESQRYEEFWGSVRNPTMLEVSGDPSNMRVTYTYEYSFPGEGRVVETVQLQLVQQGEQLLIDGDAAS